MEGPELHSGYHVSVNENISKVSGRPLAHDAYAGSQITIGTTLSSHRHGTADEYGYAVYWYIRKLRQYDCAGTAATGFRGAVNEPTLFPSDEVGHEKVNIAPTRETAIAQSPSIINRHNS